MDLEKFSEQIHTNKAWRISAHVLFWLAELLLSWYMTNISFSPYRNMGDQLVWKLTLSNTLSLILVYYPLVYLLLPLVQHKRYLAGLAGFLLLLLFYGLLNALTEDLFLLNCKHCMTLLQTTNNDYYGFLHSDLTNRVLVKVASMGMLISLFFSISVPLAFKIALQAFRQQIAAIRLAKENAELEFNFLRAQVNPHFLFNSLNNIYGLILKKENAVAAETVARLAEFMRYTLYSSDSEKVPLEKEIGLLRDYIDLEKIRLNHTLVEAELQADPPSRGLPPLLLFPLIENAFKYSADLPGARLRIALTVRSNELELEVCNTIDEDRRLNTAGGIGLQNLKKRLQLYYQDEYRYEVNDDGSYYTVKLKISL